MDKSGKLIIVPTPIGNMGDLTPRAKKALSECDAVYCEDTRVTGRLLSMIDVSKPLHRMDENTLSEKLPNLLRYIEQGSVIAYCSDAGMPGVSDPGMRIIANVRECGLSVEVLPGACAFVLAFVCSGFKDKSIYFGGFFPRKSNEKVQVLNGLSDLEAALVFYESPNRLIDTLEAIGTVFPQRQVCVCRELTKLHEDIIVASAHELLAIFKDMRIKGEIAIVIEGADGASSKDEASLKANAAEELIAMLIEEGLRPKAAASVASRFCNVPRNDAYKIALSHKDEDA